MKGGFNNPPNQAWEEAANRPRRPSMKGGFNNPPNQRRADARTVIDGNFNEGGVQ